VGKFADGGSPRDAGNLEPMQHDEHMEFHKQNGDFARWGSRANQQAGQAGATAEGTLTPGEQMEINTRQAQRPMGEESDIPGDLDPN
jgi:hypothetical protein